ncbi:MAG TPA: putative nucleotidyltransferase substrate binding domain-containing protein [Dongiaceae bacterium]|nr:putative nucleotidyltransferase substrate binding domain-containing protein [Dongiaceae bacterium]
MNFLLSAKGEDVTAWRAVEDFVAAYRQTLLDLAASDRSGSSESVILEKCTVLEEAITTHRNIIERLNNLIEQVASAPAKELTVAFYSDLYRHFGQFHSAPVFYQMSMSFLRQTSAAVVTQATAQLGLPAGHLPELAMIAVGAAGRCEYSPFSPLQVLLVHGEATASQLRNIQVVCQLIHAGFESAGLAIDPEITPRNTIWRGTIAEWSQRCEDGLHSQADEETINLWRLIDQYPLYPGEGFGRELKQISSDALNGSRPALANLIERMTSLSNGLGFMGRLKLERSGNARGLFRLLDYGLLPLSAALSALALIKKSPAVSTCDRINDLLRRRELDVDLAERMLATWYYLHDLRLRQEQSFRIDDRSSRSSFLNPDELTFDQRQSLKQNLEAVAFILRHVEIIFSGMGE